MLMAHVRRSPQHRDPPSPPTRKYPLRGSPPSRRRRHNSEELRNHLDIRQVLVPLHPNLRRLPSRLLIAQPSQPDKILHMARHAAQVGTKRKRVASVNASNENSSQATRVRTRAKRLRSDTHSTIQHVEYATTSGEEEQEDGEADEDEDEDEPSEMDVDTATVQGSASDESEPEVGEEHDDDDETQATLSDPEEEDDSSSSLIFCLPNSPFDATFSGRPPCELSTSQAALSATQR